MDFESFNTLLVGGAVLGLMTGVLLQRSRFCIAAAVSNLVIMRDYKQLHTYLVAVMAALLGAHLLHTTGTINLAETGYTSSNITWLAAIVGGVCFGVGTMLSGGCVGRMVIRISEGDLGALLVLGVIGTTGAAALYGVLNPLYLSLLNSGSYSLISESAMLSQLLGIPGWIIIAALILMTAMFIRKTGNKWHMRYIMFTGIGMGILITLGWWITGYLAQGFESTHRPTSLTYAGPMVSSSILLISGSQLSDIAYFGIAVLAGTLSGSFIIAIWRRKFHFVLPEKHHVPNIITGGILMGFGAMLAGGCNIGQGLTGMSTLSLKPILAVISIFTGMRLGLWWLNLTETDDESVLKKFSTHIRGSFFVHR